MRDLRSDLPYSAERDTETVSLGGVSRFAVLAEASPAVVFVHQDGIFRYVNPAAETVLGYPRSELLQMHFGELIHPDFATQVRDRGARRQAGESVPPRYEFKIVTKQGQHRTLDCTASRFDFMGRPAVLGIAFDVTGQKRAEQRLAAQLAVTSGLADGSFSTANSLGILRGMCQAMDWATGSYWCLDAGTNRLRCVDVWTKPEAPLERFAAENRGLMFAPGEGLPGRVLAQGEPAWIAELGSDLGFRRRESAEAARLRGACAFPIRIDGAVQHVVEFFYQDLLEPDVELMRVFSAMGLQMGQFLERSRAVEQVRASEERFRRLFEFSPVPIALHRDDGRYLKVNRAYQQMVGYSAHELGALGVKQITYPDDVPEGQQRGKEMTAGTCDTYEHEKRFLHKDGQVIWTRAAASAVRNAEGKLEYVISVLEDITKRKREEAVTVEFSNLVHRLSAAFSAKDAAHTIVDAASNLFGWDACYLHLLTPEGLIHPLLTFDMVQDSRSEIPPTAFTLDPSPLMLEVLAGGARLINREPLATVAAPTLTPFGDVSRPSASMMYVPIRSDSQSIGVMSVQSYRHHAYGEEDLRLLQSLADQCAAAFERINAVEELGRSEATQRALLNAMPDLMLCLQRDGTIVDCKAGTTDDAALRVQTGVGRKLRDCWPEEIADALLLEVAMVLNGGAPRNVEFDFSGPSGTRDYEARLVGSGPEQVLAIVRDYTERKRLETEVLMVSAREQQRIGKDLHDGLGQLLTGLAFFARSLQEKLAAKSMEEAADAAQLSQLAVKAITQARLLARGLYPVELETRGLAAALTELVYSMEKLHKISCTVELDASLPPFGKSQDKHVFRIVQEATNNAAKHSQCRRVTISLRSEGPGAVLAIRDDGCGMQPGPTSGDGMGLRIMRYRARRLGARLDVHPAPGGGTEVLLRIPGGKSAPLKPSKP